MSLRGLSCKALDAIESGDSDRLGRFEREVGLSAPRFKAATDKGALYVQGSWAHFLHEPDHMVDVRLQIDALAAKVIQAQYWDGVQYKDLNAEQVAGLQQVVIGVQEAHLEPKFSGMAFSDALQPWSANDAPPRQPAAAEPISCADLRDQWITQPRYGEGNSPSEQTSADARDSWMSGPR